ncbi:hypothetical protein TI39_contig352g00005 [Zymoseptoria brevis]|uniref:Uncharacterized protein n=1 Tax=Zymoseptoria brevis TaxID=1047168 RepID=A0A0F4GRS5_9PEZI|nr:hypothetical protein TI39_contig352g00005 [Zymoseptoria brevis]
MSGRTVRQVREVQKEIPKVAKQILTGDFTHTHFFFGLGTRPATVVDPGLWQPAFDERKVLVDRLVKVIYGHPDASDIRIAEDLTAESYPQLARHWNARAFYDLPDKYRLKTKHNHNEATISLHKPAYKEVTATDPLPIVPPNQTEATILESKTTSATDHSSDTLGKAVVGEQ